MNNKSKILFLGTSAFAVPILEKLHEEFEIVAVVTQPDRTVGRKQELTPSPVKVKALELGLKVLQPEKASEIPALLSKFKTCPSLHAGRRARVETAIGESPASVPAAAAALAQQVFDNLHGRRVVLVGAGKVSELTARNLRSRGAIVAAVANRTAAHGDALAGPVLVLVAHLPRP